MVSRILVALDESPQADAALRHALSTYPEAEIHVLHATDLRGWAGGGMDGWYYSEELYEQAQESAERLLKRAESVAAEYDMEVTTASTTGTASSAVVQYAEDYDIDHIVLGSHGRHGLARFLLGSVAEQVARRSPGSVTIIRERVAEEAA